MFLGKDPSEEVPREGFILLVNMRMMDVCEDEVVKVVTFWLFLDPVVFIVEIC